MMMMMTMVVVVVMVMVVVVVVVVGRAPQFYIYKLPIGRLSGCYWYILLLDVISCTIPYIL